LVVFGYKAGHAIAGLNIVVVARSIRPAYGINLALSEGLLPDHAPFFIF
jgi:hypothetical protein